MPDEEEKGETLTYSLSKASQGISSFFEELDIFKMMKDKDHVVYIGDEDAAHQAPNHT